MGAGLGPFSFSKLLVMLNGYDAVLLINAVMVVAGAGVLLLLGGYPRFAGAADEARPTGGRLFQTKASGEAK
ncbi:hypothetical protein SAMN05446635_7715 [Burkholderia sp. OK233]|nr:hypothetical protein SAMN05446635_7715 [Burkholderia sp. OK233]